MKIFNTHIAVKPTDLAGTAWYKGILVRTAVLSWVLIILTLFIYILGILPYQTDVLKDRMKSEANDIAGSIGQVTATAIINNDYGFTVDHCLKIIKQSKSILYITITRKDGFSLVHTKDGWRADQKKDHLNLPSGIDAGSEFTFSKLVGQEVFHYSYPFSYSGIDWGRINVGLSLKNYNQNINDLYYRTVWLALLSIFVGLAASVYFAKKLTAPIRELDNVAQTIAKGDLKARVKINIDNEIGRLAQSFNRMTISLQHSQDNLEKKVEERTSELGETNRKLKTEVNERLAAENTLKQYNLRLEALDKIYTGIISAKSVEEIAKETINHLQKLFPSSCMASVELFDFNSAQTTTFSKKFNNRNSDLIEKKIHTAVHNQNFSVAAKNGIILAGNDNIIVEENSYSPSGLSAQLYMENTIIGRLNIESYKVDVFKDEDDEVLNIVANQLAVAIHQAQLQAQINEHAETLQNSLSEKEVLLKEIHHRVKNNLQVISSLLYLNSRKIKDKETLDMFKESQNRVKSIALVHERLYQSKDLANIDFSEYIKKLTADLFRSYGVNQAVINLEIDVEDIPISIDMAVPCGLIINELISNSLKYAFPDYESKNLQGTIKIIFKKLGRDEVYLCIKDNGVGITNDLEEIKKNSLGLLLVDTLVAQLEGELSIKLTGGTSFSIRFKVEN